jgi:hypothetical protein
LAIQANATTQLFTSQAAAHAFMVIQRRGARSCPGCRRHIFNKLDQLLGHKAACGTTATHFTARNNMPRLARPGSTLSAQLVVIVITAHQKTQATTLENMLVPCKVFEGMPLPMSAD